MIVPAGKSQVPVRKAIWSRVRRVNAAPFDHCTITPLGWLPRYARSLNDTGV